MESELLLFWCRAQDDQVRDVFDGHDEDPSKKREFIKIYINHVIDSMVHL